LHIIGFGNNRAENNCMKNKISLSLHAGVLYHHED
jgi:hypothetical protein